MLHHTGIKIMTMESVDILHRALALVREDRGMPALEAIQRVSQGSEPEARRRAGELFQQALVRPEVGLGTSFQDRILERAIEFAQKETKAMAVSIGRKEMTENTNEKKAAPSADTIASRGKRYMVGDMHRTVALMGLQPTDATRNAACQYQFSRKTGRDGTMDLPADTEVRYVGAKAVYEGVAASKRMIFRVAKGSKAVLDGQEVILDSDIDIAGVPNHVDADDPYNIAARANEAKKAEKASLKAAANAKKTAAA